MNDASGVKAAARTLRVLQHLAERMGVDVLHIKGVAADPRWRSPGGGTDADVLVRPSHVRRFVERAADVKGWSCARARARRRRRR